MAWAKFDDNFYDHPKVIKIWRRNPASLGLHVRAITYCSRHLTDGIIPAAVVESLSPLQRDREEQVAALIEEQAWYWDEASESFAIHDFLDYNPTRADLDEKREKDRERKRKAKEL
jgi:hypothetical protein